MPKSDNLKKRNEFYLLCGILALAVVFFAGYRYVNRGEASVAVVSADGQTIRELPLSRDADIIVEGKGGGTNRVIIKDGAVSITEASCPDLICIREGKKKEKGDVITCLPNRIIVTIK